MIYFGLLAIACGFIGIAALGCGVGQGIAVYGAVNSVARQPEMHGKIQIMMFIGLAFIESLTIYSLVISFILAGKLPKTEAVLEAFKMMSRAV